MKSECNNMHGERIKIHIVLCGPCMRCGLVGLKVEIAGQTAMKVSSVEF